MLQYHSDTIYI